MNCQVGGLMEESQHVESVAPLHHSDKTALGHLLRFHATTIQGPERLGEDVHKGCKCDKDKFTAALEAVPGKK